jgi:uncharacterized RDD family membrane protein YckC
MTAMTDDTTGLPDPDTDPQFYINVAPKRLLAWGIDLVLTVGITVAITLASFGLLLVLAVPVFFLTNLIYRIWSIAAHSATPGMRFMAIELRGHTGARLDTGEAVLHTLGYLVVTSFVIPQLIGIAMMATGPRGKGLHDLLIGSTAINRPAEY